MVDMDIYLVVYRPTYISDLGLYVQGQKKLSPEEAFRLIKKKSFQEGLFFEIGHLTGKDVDRIKQAAEKAETLESFYNLLKEEENSEAVADIDLRKPTRGRAPKRTEQ